MAALPKAHPELIQPVLLRVEAGAAWSASRSRLPSVLQPYRFSLCIPSAEAIGGLPGLRKPPGNVATGRTRLADATITGPQQRLTMHYSVRYLSFSSGRTFLGVPHWRHHTGRILLSPAHRSGRTLSAWEVLALPSTGPQVRGAESLPSARQVPGQGHYTPMCSVNRESHAVPGTIGSYSRGLR